MSRLDHIAINVSNYVAPRDWYANNFGLRVEFEDLKAGVGGLEDDGNTELILVQTVMQDRARDCSLTFQCESVHAKRGGDQQSTLTRSADRAPGLSSAGA